MKPRAYQINKTCQLTNDTEHNNVQAKTEKNL